MREGLDHECQTYRRGTRNDERRGTTQVLLLGCRLTITSVARSTVSAKLVKLGLAREIEAKPEAPIWRRDDAGQGYALKLTAAGLKAIAVDEGSQDAIEPGEAPQPQTNTGTSANKGRYWVVWPPRETVASWRR